MKFLMSNFLSLLIFPTNFIVIFSLIGLGITGRSAQSAVSSGDSLKAGSFIEAVKKEDLNLLEKRIRVRLAGPLSDFIEELYFTTKEGRNIFHYLAGVETKREEFAVILEGLIRLVDPSFFPNTSATVTLAGITFSLEKHPPPNLLLEDGGNIQQKMEKLYKEISALSALAYLHSRAETVTALYRNHLKNLEEGSDLIWLNNKVKVFHLVVKIIFQPFPVMSWLNNKIKVFHLAEDNQKISPRKLAAHNGNLSALNVLKNKNRAKHLDSDLLSLYGNAAGFGAFTGVMTGIFLDTVIPQPGFSFMVLGMGVGAVAGLAACHDFFRNKKKPK